MTTLNSPDIAQIAKICHTANMAYAQTLGDTSIKSWEDSDQAQRDSIMNGVLFRINNPGAPDSASHDNWLACKRADGWVYGPVKDAANKVHPCFVEYDRLPAEQQMKDHLFTGIVNALTGTTVAQCVCVPDPEPAVLLSTAPPAPLATSRYSAPTRVPAIAASAYNDPDVQIGMAVSMPPDVRAVLTQLGFVEVVGNAFVYNSNKRGIWVDGAATLADIMPKITACAEAIGERKKINQIRSALDIPFNDIATENLS